MKSEVPVRVPGRTLLGLSERYGPFSVLIIDIEGSELECLRSSRSILDRFRLVLIELHDWVIGADGVEECRRILKESGFEMTDRSFITEAWAKR
jgi:hypothetical protein